MTKTLGQEDISKVTPLQRVRKYLRHSHSEDIQAVLKAKRRARFYFSSNKVSQPPPSTTTI